MRDGAEKIRRIMEKHHARKLGYGYPTAIRKKEIVRNGMVSEIRYLVGYDMYHYSLDMGYWSFETSFELDKSDGEIAVAWLKEKKREEDTERKRKEEYYKRNFAKVSEV